jgi:hypothetical protein
MRRIVPLMRVANSASSLATTVAGIGLTAKEATALDTATSTGSPLGQFSRLAATAGKRDGQQHSDGSLDLHHL